MPNSVNAVNIDEWEEAKAGLPDKIQGIFTKDDFFAKARQIGFNDPELVRAMYVIGGAPEGSFYLEMPVISLMLDDVEKNSPERIIDMFCHRMDDHNRKHPKNNIGKKYTKEAGAIIDEWNLQNMDKDDYVKRYRPDEFNPWESAMSSLPAFLGGNNVTEFFQDMRKLGFDEEEDIPVISALYELSGVSKDLNIGDILRDEGASAFEDTDDVISYILDRVEEPKYKEVFRTHKEQMQTLYEYYNTKNPEDKREPAYEIDTRTGLLRTAEDMAQVKRLDEHINKVKNDKPWIDDLSRKSQHLIYGDHDLRTLAEMFNTKKTLRFLQGGDSSEYKEARDSLNTYVTKLDDVKDLLKSAREDLDNELISKEQYEEKIKGYMDDIKESEKELRRTMSAYAIKVTKGSKEEGTLGDKKIEDMTATGAARLSSAMCVLDFLDTADVLRGEWKQTYGDVRDEERVKEIDYAKLYAKKFGEIKDEKNRHRRAAAYAQNEMKTAAQKKEQSDMKSMS